MIYLFHSISVLLFPRVLGNLQFIPIAFILGSVRSKQLSTISIQLSNLPIISPTFSHLVSSVTLTAVNYIFFLLKQRNRSNISPCKIIVLFSLTFSHINVLSVNGTFSHSQNRRCAKTV